MPCATCSATSYSTRTATSCAVPASRCTSSPRCSTCSRYLVDHRDRVVTKPELLDAVWGDRFVSESALTSRIKAARQAVGDDGAAQQVIRTVHGRGYQFVADVVVDVDGEPGRGPGLGRPATSNRRSASAPRPTACASPTPPSATARRSSGPRTGSPTSTTTGTAPCGATGSRASPAAARWCATTSVGAGSRTTTSPSGRSTRSSHDLETVVDAAGLERFPLLGVSQGGAGRHRLRRPPPGAGEPPRAASAPTRRAASGAPAPTSERREAELQVEMARVGWGRDDPTFRRFFTSSFIPDAAARAVGRVRRAAAPHDARPRTPPRSWPTWSDIDVADAGQPARRARRSSSTPATSCGCPFEQARAAGAPRSRAAAWCPLDTRNHLIRADEPAWRQLPRRGRRLPGRGRGLTRRQAGPRHAAGTGGASSTSRADAVLDEGVRAVRPPGR